MGEEEKKPEEKKPKEEEAKKPEEESKKEDPKAEKNNDKKEEKKGEESKDPPPQEIVLRVYMHCEGCARKVRRSLKGFLGVEDVQTDCKTHKVVVKGEKADPLKVQERVQRKSHGQVDLLTPIPKPPEPKKVEEKEVVKPEEKKEEPQVITVVLRVHMHCEACAQEIKKRIQRMKGIESAEPDLKSSQVTVKGVFDPKKLVEYVYKRIGKHATILKVDPEKKEEEKGKEEKKEEEKGKEEKKGEDGEKDAKKGGEEEGKDKKEGTEEEGAKAEGNQEEEAKVEITRNEFYHYNPLNYQVPPYQQRLAAAAQDLYAYPPQIFSDENPNACSIV